MPDAKIKAAIYTALVAKDIEGAATFDVLRLGNVPIMVLGGIHFIYAADADKLVADGMLDLPPETANGYIKVKDLRIRRDQYPYVLSDALFRKLSAAEARQLPADDGTYRILFVFDDPTFAPENLVYGVVPDSEKCDFRIKVGQYSVGVVALGGYGNQFINNPVYDFNSNVTTEEDRS